MISIPAISKTVPGIIAALVIMAPATSAAELAAGFDEALSADGRPAEDKVRDAARQPRAVLDFLGIGSGMTVLDVLASTGWYTEVLSAAVGVDGVVIAFNTVGRRDRSHEARRQIVRHAQVIERYRSRSGVYLDPGGDRISDDRRGRGARVLLRTCQSRFRG